MNDFLEFGDLVVEMLQENLQGMNVVKAFEVPELDETTVSGTTVFLMFEGYEVLSVNSNGKVVEFGHRWVALIATRTPTTIGDALVQVISNISGFTPDGYMPCQLTEGAKGKSGWTPGGVHYVDVSFSTSFYLQFG
ncbi:MAG: hypothetical protein HQL95_01735 [Magnetococcales bacterium]|nr:hypothetical protein [Magnetococcales bacterium]